jgi:alanine racemase
MYRRPTFAIIHLDALVHNFNEVCHLAKDRSLVVPVVKSDAYGHGCIRVSKELIKAGAQRFAVSLTEEAVELRGTGVAVPILVLGGVYPAQAKEIIEQGLTPVISTASMANALIEASEAMRKSVAVHIKVETGLGRMGIQTEDVSSFLHYLRKRPYLSVEGVCTSFSSIDDVEFSKKQFHLFERVAKEAEQIAGKPLLRHLAHTGGLICGLTQPGWLIRPGIMLYGYTRGLRSSGFNLRPVLTWKTEIFKIEKYPTGYPIGYSGLFKTTPESRIALLPLGYSDGLLRSYTGRGEVLIRGRRVPLVGRFSMDWTSAEVGHLPEVREGDEVIVIGRQGIEFISAEEVAERSGTIADEVLVSIARRVPRIYQE